MLTPYRRVLAEPGAALFSATGFVARLPLSMVSLGLVLLVADATGSYALAGSVSAAYVVAEAALAILHGRLVDRLGQGRVLATAATLVAVFLGLTVWAVQADWPSVTIYVFAALAGAALPQVGACIRARWTHVLDDPAQLRTAYALESVVDEAVFILGPVVVTVLAVAWHPVAGLGIAVLAGLAGAWGLAFQRRTEPPARPRSHDRADDEQMPWAQVAALTGVCFALGIAFGAAEVGTVAFADEHDAKQWAGPLLALWALGSLVSGILTGLVHWRGSPVTRIRWGILGVGLAMAPLTAVSSMPLLGLLLLLGGFAVSPTLIATMEMTQRTVPRGRLTEGMAVLHTGLAAGVAPGAALAGIVIDTRGAAVSYAVPAAAGLLGALVAFLVLRSDAAPAGPPAHAEPALPDPAHQDPALRD
jgi:MFS family permease